MSQSSVKLFQAWTTRHKEAIALEDALELARRQDPARVPELEAAAAQARASAEAMLQQALQRFREEVRERGLD